MATPDRPTLMEHLSRQEVRRIAEQRLLGAPDVQLLSLFWTGLLLFQKGAILGRARADRLDVLAKMLFEPGTEGNVRRLVDSLAADLINKYGGEPSSFLDFWAKTELPQELASTLFDAGVMEKLSEKRIQMAEAGDKVAYWVLSGIAFGAKFPEIIEKMWQEMRETHDTDAWVQARRWGLAIPGDDTPLSLEEMERSVLREVATYASEYFPELVEPLGLSEGFSAL